MAGYAKELVFAKLGALFSGGMESQMGFGVAGAVKIDSKVVDVN